ncbi:hypothetical protein BN11_4280020 [Nostocoides australiense Ben110]|uniref:Uncharacterized protein n=1 Tax=Nostocoides australiense Ben110 TaxID=1193182 RepID=W6K439_9MICO|nr:hypothetical protein BN11_4280020 [Tetrasphaera australiensis Ben110]
MGSGATRGSARSGRRPGSAYPSATSTTGAPAPPRLRNTSRAAPGWRGRPAAKPRACPSIRSAGRCGPRPGRSGASSRRPCRTGPGRTRNRRRHWVHPRCRCCPDPGRWARRCSRVRRHGDPKVAAYKPSDFKIPILREVLKAFPDTRSISRSRAPATPTSPPAIAPRASWRRS